MTFVHWIFDNLLRPLNELTLQASLVVLAVAIAALATLAFHLLTNQAKLRRAADRTQAELLAIKLFKHDPAAVGRAEVRLLRSVALRLWHALPATLVLAIPVSLLLIELAPRYERRPIAPGEAVVVEMPTWRGERYALEADPSLRIETPALLDRDRDSLAWRVRATAPGRPQVWREWQKVGYWAEFDVVPDPKHRWLVPSRIALGAEPVVYYPPRDFTFLRMPWWLALLLGSMLFAWLFGRVLGIRY
jgi:hypothetical protein